MTEKREMPGAGMFIKGNLSDISTFTTATGKTMYTLFVFTGRQVERVKTMDVTGLKQGDKYYAAINCKPYVSKSGQVGLEIWEAAR